MDIHLQTTAYGRGEDEVMCALNAHLAVRLRSNRCLPSLKNIKIAGSFARLHSLGRCGQSVSKLLATDFRCQLLVHRFEVLSTVAQDCEAQYGELMTTLTARGRLNLLRDGRYTLRATQIRRLIAQRQSFPSHR